MTNETQESITKWSRETFGDSTPYAVAKRMQIEVGELVEALSFAETGEVPRILEALEECADVSIMLQQIAELLDIPTKLYEAVNTKMEINRERRWQEVLPGVYQHVKIFFHEPSGVELSLRNWYIISDSGALAELRAFRSEESALEYQPGLMTPKFFGGENGWEDIVVENGGLVVWGRDLYDYYIAQGAES